MGSIEEEEVKFGIERVLFDAQGVRFLSREKEAIGDELESIWMCQEVASKYSGKWATLT